MAVANETAAYVGRAASAVRMLRTRLHPRSITVAACGFALVLFAEAAAGQTAAIQTQPAAADAPGQAAPAPAVSESHVPVPPKVIYKGGQLTIGALDSTLADILENVAEVTGVKIDVPDSAKSQRIAGVELGPGPPREILASLLSDLTFDYLILASDSDSEKIQRVLLMAREKNVGGGNLADAGVRPPRGPSMRGGATASRVDDAPPEDPAPAPIQTAAVDPNASNPQPAPVQPDQPTQVPTTQPDQSGLPRPGAMSPPQTLNSQSINQQLQQMYQQRMQMNPQGQTTPSVTPATSGGK